MRPLILNKSQPILKHISMKANQLALIQIKFTFLERSMAKSDGQYHL